MKLVCYQAHASRVFDAPRSLVWALVSDTNRSDRALGLSAATYRWEQDEATGEQIRIATAKELGVELSWVEPPYQWVEGRLIQGMRRFTKGPVAEGFFRAQLEDEEDGRTRLNATAGMAADTLFGRAMGPVQRVKFRRNLERYLDAIGEVLASWQDADLGTEEEPAAVRARRLLVREYDALTSGPRTLPDRAVLAQRAQRLRAAPVPEEVRERLVAHLDERPDEEVSQMRPFELAGLWNLDRRDVLRTFLHATVSGLTDLRWQINCPVCRVGASVVEDLSDIGETSHCQACQIHYDTDFAKHVEAVFPVNPAVRAVQPALYCASSPAFLPHVMAQLKCPAGERREVTADLPTGEIHARILGRTGGADIVAERRDRVLELTIGDEALGAALVEGDAPAIRIVNETDADHVVLVERAGWAADAVLGTLMSSFPEFLDLFATEAPASGVDLRVGHLAILFSDLVGSTALYERIGDARAYALVEEHFRLAQRAVASSGGAIVKTMGDAVMASFPSAREAVTAARAMIASHDEAYANRELGVKVGVHGGPCLAVRANERLDFFGTTVNMAARLQAKATASEIVLTREAYDDPTVAPLLEGLPIREFSAALKGIASEQALVAVSCAVTNEAGDQAAPSGRSPSSENRVRAEH